MMLIGYIKYMALSCKVTCYHAIGDCLLFALGNKDSDCSRVTKQV
jgi:hypothetical protein